MNETLTFHEGDEVDPPFNFKGEARDGSSLLIYSAGASCAGLWHSEHLQVAVHLVLMQISLRIAALFHSLKSSLNSADSADDTLTEVSSMILSL